MATPEGTAKEQVLAENLMSSPVNLSNLRNRIRNFIDKNPHQETSVERINELSSVPPREACAAHHAGHSLQWYLQQQHYDSALFWADKLVSLSDAVEDVFWYAQTMYYTGQYHSAIHLLTSRKLDKTYSACRYLTAKCYYECKEWQEALNILEMADVSFSHVPSITTSSLNESLQESDASFPIKNYENSICLLRGKIYEAMDNRSLASDCYREALRLDVYCFEALELLINHHMLTAQEEKDLINSLPLSSQCIPEEADLVRSLYESRMKKYDCPGKAELPASLTPLSDNMDVIVSKAERHLYNCNFRAAYKITSKVLDMDPYNRQCLPIHIAVLVELKNSNELFYLAHKLVDYYPDKSISWFAVGCYYMVTENFLPSRWYLSKATTLERAHGPSWLAYGHTFGVNKDHDQAMAAYFTASQIMRGCHLPQLYIGLEYGLTNNPKLAERFFSQALSIAPEDPFVLHEMGVIAFGNLDYMEAERCFQKALNCIQSVGDEMPPERWEPLLNNLGHTSRKLGRYEAALEYHTQAEILCPQTASTYSAIGFVHSLMGNNSEALNYFHKALGLRKDDMFSTKMLTSSMEALMLEMSACDDTDDQPGCLSPSKDQAQAFKLTEIFSCMPQNSESLDNSKTGFDSMDNNNPFMESSLSIDEVDMDDCSS